MRKTKRKVRLVFISHSGRDTWVAKQIAREVEACGAKPFLDEAEIDVGADFEEDILAFLRKAHELVESASQAAKTDISFIGENHYESN